MSEKDQKHRFERRPITSGLPQLRTFSGSVGMSQTCQRTKSLRDSPLRG